MRKYKTVTVPAETKERLEKVVCDLCGKESPRDGWWGKDQYDVAQTELRCKTGESYPEGGSGVEETVDMCVECWRGKFIPWLASLGAKPTTKEWEW